MMRYDTYGEVLEGPVSVVVDDVEPVNELS